MRIVVDDRERNEGLLAVLKNEAGLDIYFQRLQAGDYLLPNILVERKTYQDFCESIRNGRLFRQAINLARSPIQPLIIVEAPTSSIFKNPVGVEAVRGAFITLSILYGIPIIKSRNSSDSAKIILQVNQQIEAFGVSNHRWKRPQPAKNIKGQKRKMQIHFLQGFPGIGPTKAIQLIEQFGSIRNIVNLRSEELLAIPGIGRKLIKKIQELLS